MKKLTIPMTLLAAVWLALVVFAGAARAADFPAAKINFEVGKADLPGDAKASVEATAQYLAANKDAKVDLAGYVDASGDPAKNAELAKQRAVAVREALKTAGVADDRINMVKPADIKGGGDAAEARRVEIMLAQATPAAAPAAAADAKPADAAAPAAPAAPSATEPSVVSNAQINSGDTAWMLSSTALVLLMTIPGLALFYGGMVRKKNVLATLMQSFAICCVVTILFLVVGYSIAFTPGSPYYGGLSRLMMHGMIYVKDIAAVAAAEGTPAAAAIAGKVSVSHIANTIPESVFFMFQMTFAIITPALIAGAFADRMKFSAMLAFMAIWSVFVYSPIAHWVWEPSGWLAQKGVLDFAGGTVVHINAGIAGLVCALVLGKRVGYGKEPMAPHNLTLTVIGASLLWVGWFGFNAGSAVASDGRAGMAMAVTQIATAAAALAWMFTEWLTKGKPSVLGIASGAVAGLVAITPASGFVMPGGALVIGIAAGVLCYLAATSIKRALGYDDSLDAFGVHCIGGIVGALLTGVFAVKELSGLDASLLSQVIGVVSTLVYSGVMSFIILKVIDVVIGLRVSEEDEREGLDITLHGESIE